MFALKTVFAPASSRQGVFAICAGAEAWTVTIASGHIEVARGLDRSADVTFDTDLQTLRAFAFGRESLSAAEAGGRLTVVGDRRRAKSFSQMFPVP